MNIMNETKKEYLKTILEFANEVNPDYGNSLKLLLNFANDDNPEKTYPKIEKDLKNIERLINDAKIVLEMAKILNRELYENLIKDIRQYDLDDLIEWKAINNLALYSLHIKEKNGKDLTIDQLIEGPFSCNSVFVFLVQNVQNPERHEKVIQASISDSSLNYKYVKFVPSTTNIDEELKLLNLLQQTGNLQPEDVNKVAKKI